MMTDAQINHILYFQKWHMEYSKAAMFSREMGQMKKATEFQRLAAENFRVIEHWRKEFSE